MAERSGSATTCRHLLQVRLDYKVGKGCVPRCTDFTWQDGAIGGVTQGETPWVKVEARSSSGSQVYTPNTKLYCELLCAVGSLPLKGDDYLRAVTLTLAKRRQEEEVEITCMGAGCRGVGLGFSSP